MTRGDRLFTLAKNTSTSQANWVLLRYDYNRLEFSLTVPVGVSHWLPAEHQFRVCLCPNFHLTMNPEPNNVRRKELKNCGFSLREKDLHEACPICLGIVLARRALTDLDSCVHCRLLLGPTLEKRVKLMEKVLCKATVAQHDPLLSSLKGLALSLSDVEELGRPHGVR